MRLSCLLAGFLAGFLFVGSFAAATPDAVLGDPLAGWRRQGPIATYGPEDLYDWIDGAAEVYRSLNVRRVASGRYSLEGVSEALVDVFDMGSPEDAYGAYHHDIRQGKSGGIGEESERDGTNVALWKGRYFVSVVGLSAGREVEERVMELAREVAARIPGPSRSPEIVSWLPEDGLVRSQIHYFHDSLLLGTHLDVGSGNPLGLSADTEGLVARYAGPSREDMVLLLVRYPEPEVAGRSMERLQGLATVLASSVKGPALIAVFGTADAARAEELVRMVGRRIAP